MLGLSYLASVPPVGDDLVVVAKGMSHLVTADNFASFLWAETTEAISSTHVLPAGGAFTALYVSAAKVLAIGPLTMSQSWGLLRVISVLVAAMSTAYFLYSARTLTGLPPVGVRRPFLTIYCAVAAVALATIQVHALWSQDPVISYPVASWFSVVLGMLLGAAVVRTWDSNSSRRQSTTWSVVAMLIATIGILHYEMMLAAVVAALVLSVFLALRGGVSDRPLRMWLTLPYVVVPIAVFVVTQLVRIRLPSEYSDGDSFTYEGTQVGHRAWVIQAVVVGAAGHLPLANGKLTLQHTNSISGSSSFIGLSLLAVAALLSLLWFLARGHSAEVPRLRPLLTSALPLLAFVFTLTVLSVGIFAMTSKYQADMATQFGWVYLYYATGFMALTSTLALILLWSTRQKAFFAVGMALLMMLTSVQVSLNLRSTEALIEERAWSARLIDALDTQTPLDERCELIAEFKELGGPEWFRVDGLEALQTAHKAIHGDPYC